MIRRKSTLINVSEFYWYWKQKKKKITNQSRRNILTSRSTFCTEFDRRTEYQASAFGNWKRDPITLASRAWKRNSRKVINNFVFFTRKCSFSALKRILNTRIHIYTHGTDGVPAIFEDFNETWGRGGASYTWITRCRENVNVTVRENDETSSIRVCFRQLRLRAC